LALSDSEVELVAVAVAKKTSEKILLVPHQYIPSYPPIGVVAGTDDVMDVHEDTAGKPWQELEMLRGRHLEV